MTPDQEFWLRTWRRNRSDYLERAETEPSPSHRAYLLQQAAHYARLINYGMRRMA